jgi:hypothetical protein
MRRMGGSHEIKEMAQFLNRDSNRIPARVIFGQRKRLLSDGRRYNCTGPHKIYVLAFGQTLDCNLYFSVSVNQPGPGSGCRMSLENTGPHVLGKYGTICSCKTQDHMSLEDKRQHVLARHGTTYPCKTRDHMSLRDTGPHVLARHKTICYRKTRDPMSLRDTGPHILARHGTTCPSKTRDHVSLQDTGPHVLPRHGPHVLVRHGTTYPCKTRDHMSFQDTGPQVLARQGTTAITCSYRCMRVNTGGVWTGDRTHWTLQHTTRVHTFRSTVTQRLTTVRINGVLDSVHRPEF